MGTRHLTCVVKDGAFKVAQYGQWDGHPTGAGAIVLEFLDRIQKLPDGLQRFREAVDNCIFLSDEEIHSSWIDAGADPESDYVTMEVSDRHGEMYPALSRDTGARVLEYIFNQCGSSLKNSVDFAGDSLFCEWAYVIDLDAQQLEVYRGFNTSRARPLGRFADFEPEPKSDYEGAEQYYPIELVKVYRFDELPTVEQLVADVDSEEEEES